MAIYVVECADGSSRHCTRTVEATIDLEGLTPDQVDDVRAHDGACLTESQLRLNGIELTEEQKKDLKENGCVYIEAYIENDTCAPCGSDQDYDDEGNNVTGE